MFDRNGELLQLMKDFIDQFQEFSMLDDAAKLDLISVARLQHFKKGEVILPVGNVCRHLYFVNSGLVKIFSFKDGKEFIMRFFSESQICSVYDSFLTKTPANFTIFYPRRFINHNQKKFYTFQVGLNNFKEEDLALAPPLLVPAIEATSF